MSMFLLFWVCFWQNLGLFRLSLKNMLGPKIVGDTAVWWWTSSLSEQQGIGFHSLSNMSKVFIVLAPGWRSSQSCQTAISQELTVPGLFMPCLVVTYWSELFTRKHRPGSSLIMHSVIMSGSYEQCFLYCTSSKGVKEPTQNLSSNNLIITNIYYCVLEDMPW